MQFKQKRHNAKIVPAHMLGSLMRFQYKRDPVSPPLKPNLSVLQISSFYSNMGGVEKSVSDLVSGLKREHDVRVLCTQKGTRTSRERLDGVNVTSVGGVISFSGRPLAHTFPWELRRQHCDVVHYHLPFPLAMAAHVISAPRARLKVATWHHDLVKNPRFNKMMRPLLEMFLDDLDVILVTAPALIENTPVLKKREHKCRVVPLGIDDEPFVTFADKLISGTYVAEFSAESLKALPQTVPLVLFVGRLVYYKGIDVLLKAMNKIRHENAHLAIVGEGPLRDELESIAVSFKISERVHFLGRISDQELLQVYNRSSLFVLPSTLPTECFGLVQVEAMLAAKPVINTNLPTGVPWVSVHGETGITVKPADVDDLSNAIDHLLDNNKLRLELGEKAKLRAQNMFTLSRHVKSVAELYQEFLT